MIVFKNLKQYRKESLIAPLFKMLEAFFDLCVPLVMAAIIDTGIANKDNDYVIRMSLVLVLLAVLGISCTIVAQYFAAKAATGFVGKTRHMLYEHLQSLSYSQLDTLGTSTMITRLTSDCNQIQTGLNLALRLLMRSPMIVFGSLIMAFRINASLALIYLVVIAILFVVVFFIMLVSLPMYRKVQAQLDNVTRKTRENLTGVRVIRAFNQQAKQQTDFQNATKNLYQQQFKVGSVASLLNPLTYVIINLAVVVLLQQGAIKVNSGLITQGQMIALYNYMSQILVELVKLANLIINITKALACARRIEDIMHIVPAQKDKGVTKGKDSEYQLVFDNVSLAYPGSSVESLENISFKVKQGETIGIIGPTGSGKSSLASLISRNYDTTSGTIYLDGVEIKDYDLSWLRNQVAVVGQKAVLFSGTIKQNLLWGNPNANEEQLQKALETAQAVNVVNDKGGLDAVVEQGGRNFSGGQKQRLTIARALVKQGRILILDDSSSALDYATDANLRLALQMLDPKPTIFIVAQRTSSIAHADKILVLDDGKLVGEGSHEQLLRECSLYKEIYYSQNRKEGKENE